jgi:carboxyl-terminal processing protease
MSAMSEREARGGGAARFGGWVAAALIGTTLAALVHASPFGGRRAPRASVEDVRALVKSRYVREVDDRTLTYGALRGIAGTLDPYSAFLSPEETVEFREDTDGDLSGIGIEITLERGYVTVIAPIEDSPAWHAGILPGDRIIGIDGKPHEFASADEAARLIKGPADSSVRLTVVHEGAARPEELVIVRKRITVPSVKRPRIVDVEAGVGYVRIASFGPRSDEEALAAVRSLAERGARALVLDLRANPGGHLDAAIAIADLFVDEGTILRTLSRDPRESRTYESTRPATPADGFSAMPLAVLVNGASASASEIVAAALQEARRATVVGTRTFGKGSVQTVIPLLGEADGEAVLKLTTARFYTGLGRPIQREPGALEAEPWGVRPDVEVDLEARTLLEIFRRRDALAAREAGAGGGAGGAAPAQGAGGNGGAASLAEPPRDPQLDAAVEALRRALAGGGGGAGTGTGTGTGAGRGAGAGASRNAGGD